MILLGFWVWPQAFVEGWSILETQDGESNVMPLRQRARNPLRNSLTARVDSVTIE
jgi:hypothetical protein